MSENIKMEDLIEEEVDTTSEPTKEEVVVEPEKEPEPEQDPLKLELDRVKQKDPTKELDKATKSLYFNAKRVKELGGDPNTILGIEKDAEEYDEDDKPLTVGMLKKLQQENAEKSALQKADEIKNETERELVKYHLSNTIKSTGNAEEDLKLARSLVNAVKNTQIIEEVKRKIPAKTHSSSSGVDANDDEIRGELTQQEKLFLGKPFNMTKEAILKLRK